MLSDEIKLAGRRVLRREWHKSLTEQSVAQDEATAYLAEVLDGILEDIQVDFKAFGVSVGEEVASYRATFQPLNLMPKGAVH